jgi:hypothetical protein
VKAPNSIWKWLSQEQPTIAALGAISGTFIGMAGLGFGIFTYISDDDAPPELEQAAVSIERRLGDETQFYDVRDIVVSPDEVNDVLPDSDYYAQDDFYALPEDQLGDWVYDYTTESEFYDLTIGEDILPEDLPELPLHLWRSDLHEMLIPEPVTQFDYVFVERLSLEQFSELFDVNTEPPPESDTDVTALARRYLPDAAGTMLVSQLPLMFPVGIPGLRPVLNSVQKSGNVVYAKGTIEVLDPIRDGEQLDQFFFEREIMIVTTQSDVWLIQTNVGTEDRTGPSFQWLDDWFLHFGIVDEG